MSKEIMLWICYDCGSEMEGPVNEPRLKRNCEECGSIKYYNGGLKKDKVIQKMSREIYDKKLKEIDLQFAADKLRLNKVWLARRNRVIKIFTTDIGKEEE